MAQILQDDFFSEVDAIAKGDIKRAAKLRFAHAEIVAPFASKLGLNNVLVQVPIATVFSYANNPWRGKHVVPMAANVQWDVYSDGRGNVLVKMLYNEEKRTSRRSATAPSLRRTVATTTFVSSAPVMATSPKAEYARASRAGYGTRRRSSVSGKSGCTPPVLGAVRPGE